MNQQNNSQNLPIEDTAENLTNTTEEKAVSDNPENKKSKVKKVLLWILIVLLVLILSGAVTVAVLIQKGKTSLLNTESMDMNPGSIISDVVVEDDGRTIEYQGKKYVYNENMTTILCIGVDKENIADSMGLQGNNGQADALFLYAMDTTTGKSTVIPIPRDAMVDVDMYSGSGQYLSSSKKQLCLSYAYGDGKHSSCENTIKSVSRLFYGLPINSYVAIDLKAIEVLSKKVGGVPVIPNEDFSHNGYNFYKGKETLLNGMQARIFVQGRDQSKLDSSLNRMERQKQFVTSFFNKAVSKTKQNITFPIDVFKSTTDYMITDIDVAEVSFLASCVIKNSIGLEYKSIKGNMVKGEKYAEYHVDDESVYNTIVEVFYKTVS